MQQQQASQPNYSHQVQQQQYFGHVRSMNSLEEIKEKYEEEMNSLAGSAIRNFPTFYSDDKSGLASGIKVENGETTTTEEVASPEKQQFSGEKEAAIMHAFRDPMRQFSDKELAAAAAAALNMNRSIPYDEVFDARFASPEAGQNNRQFEMDDHPNSFPDIEGVSYLGDDQVNQSDLRISQNFAQSDDKQQQEGDGYFHEYPLETQEDDDEEQEVLEDDNNDEEEDDDEYQESDSQERNTKFRDDMLQSLANVQQKVGGIMVYNSEIHQAHMMTMEESQQVIAGQQNTIKVLCHKAEELSAKYQQAKNDKMLLNAQLKDLKIALVSSSSAAKGDSDSVNKEIENYNTEFSSLYQEFFQEKNSYEVKLKLKEQEISKLKKIVEQNMQDIAIKEDQIANMLNDLNQPNSNVIQTPIKGPSEVYIDEADLNSGNKTAAIIIEQAQKIKELERKLQDIELNMKESDVSPLEQLREEIRMEEQSLNIEDKVQRILLRNFQNMLQELMDHYHELVNVQMKIPEFIREIFSEIILAEFKNNLSIFQEALSLENPEQNMVYNPSSIIALDQNQLALQQQQQQQQQEQESEQTAVFFEPPLPFRLDPLLEIVNLLRDSLDLEKLEITEMNLEEQLSFSLHLIDDSITQVKKLREKKSILSKQLSQEESIKNNLQNSIDDNDRQIKSLRYQIEGNFKEISAKDELFNEIEAKNKGLITECDLLKKEIELQRVKFESQLTVDSVPKLEFEQLLAKFTEQQEVNLSLKKDLEEVIVLRINLADQENKLQEISAESGRKTLEIQVLKQAQQEISYDKRQLQEKYEKLIIEFDSIRSEFTSEKENTVKGEVHDQLLIAYSKAESEIQELKKQLLRLEDSHKKQYQEQQVQYGNEKALLEQKVESIRQQQNNLQHMHEQNIISLNKSHFETEKQLKVKLQVSQEQLTMQNQKINSLLKELQDIRMNDQSAEIEKRDSEISDLQHLLEEQNFIIGKSNTQIEYLNNTINQLKDQFEQSLKQLQIENMREKERLQLESQNIQSNFIQQIRDLTAQIQKEKAFIEPLKTRAKDFESLNSNLRADLKSQTEELTRLRGLEHLFSLKGIEELGYALIGKRNTICQGMFENVSYFLREMHEVIQQKPSEFFISFYNRTFAELQTHTDRLNSKSEQIFQTLSFKNIDSVFVVTEFFELIAENFKNMLNSLLTFQAELLRNSIHSK